MIITIASQKGGVGKSTIAINLALFLAGLPEKVTVALVDTDEQKSCVETLEGHERPNLTLYEVPEAPHKVIRELEQQFIIVDTPPHSHEVMWQAAAVSDRLIIPVQPSPLDIRGAGKTVQALQTIKAKYNEKLQCMFLINRITPRTILANEIRAALEKRYPFPILKTMLHNREAYKQSLITGLSVFEYEKNSPAAKEMAQVILEMTKGVKQ